ncbi:MAG: hypothetical protein L0387_28020 [Acidobacteria bacterium]|nr:hypothetical protein [Acidobacteriota bacterium]MCI0625449.1 hypothetical protein [Acidobacteriota bacterium]
MKHVSNRVWFILFAALAIPFIAAPELHAQGCSMCKTVAAAQSSQAATSLNRGILLLLVPPVTIMTSILLFAFRCRNAPRPTAEPDESGENEEISSPAA